MYWLIGFTVWFALGCLVLSLIDDEQERLFKWASRCPIPGGYVLVVTLWPVVALVWLRR